MLFKFFRQPAIDPLQVSMTGVKMGERFLLVTHSSIDPPNFSSTTESAHYLLSALGEKPQPVRRNDRFGLELIEYFTHGEFHVRGYAGNDKADHCAQVTLLRDAFSALGRRWQREPGATHGSEGGSGQ